MSEITVSVYRFDPEKDKKPYMQDYKIDRMPVRAPCYWA